MSPNARFCIIDSGNHIKFNFGVLVFLDSPKIKVSNWEETKLRVSWIFIHLIVWQFFMLIILYLMSMLQASYPVSLVMTQQPTTSSARPWCTQKRQSQGRGVSSYSSTVTVGFSKQNSTYRLMKFLCRVINTCITLRILCLHQNKNSRLFF